MEKANKTKAGVEKADNCGNGTIHHGTIRVTTFKFIGEAWWRKSWHILTRVLNQIAALPPASEVCEGAK